MVDPQDYLETQIDLLGEKITKKHTPFTNSDHRKLVDLTRHIRKARELSKELEVTLSLPVRERVETYFTHVKNETL